MADKNVAMSLSRLLGRGNSELKPHEVARKNTACLECRKQKIKCRMQDSRPPCLRCQKKSLHCTMNRSAQALLAQDISTWKHSMETKMGRLESLIIEIGKNVLSDSQMQQLGARLEPEANTSSATCPNSAKIDPPDTLSAGVVMDLDSSPGAFPGHHLSRQKVLTLPTARVPLDIISSGVISAESAAKYLDIYQQRLDNFVYRILGDHSTSSLESIRATSPLLTAAVCTVGALHLATDDFEPCYSAFVSLTSAQSLSKENTLSDVKALCIGAFWLHDISWPLVSAGVRIATELQLHRSFFKAICPRSDREQYLRTRLYLSVYACDHHFSVVHGRPPLTRECEVIHNIRKFLDCPHATEDDSRLVSQVLRWSLCSNIYDTFGADVDRPFTQVSQFWRFSIALDKLRAEWVDKFVRNAFVRNYPRKGVGLQYHFARLYLCSHAFRGTDHTNESSTTGDMDSELDEIANMAVLSAVAILRSIVMDAEIQSYLNGLPIYFDIMIAFAAVFLVKVFMKSPATVQLEIGEIRRLMGSLSTELKKVTARMHSRHLLVGISKGIESILPRNAFTENPASPVQSTTTADNLNEERQSALEDSNFSWLLDSEGVDQHFLSEYDFRSVWDDVTTGFDFVENLPCDGYGRL